MYIHIYVYILFYACMTYACMRACMYVCTYVCMYNISLYICVRCTYMYIYRTYFYAMQIYVFSFDSTLYDCSVTTTIYEYLYIYIHIYMCESMAQGLWGSLDGSNSCFAQGMTTTINFVDRDLLQKSARHELAHV